MGWTRVIGLVLLVWGLHNGAGAMAFAKSCDWGAWPCGRVGCSGSVGVGALPLCCVCTRRCHGRPVRHRNRRPGGEPGRHRREVMRREL